MTSSGSTLSVAAGASVSGGTPGAITVTSSSSYLARNFVNILGSVDGFGGAGIALLPGTISYSSAGTKVIVGQTGSVTGATGIMLGSTGLASQQVYAEIDNSGSITATSGPALVSQSSNQVGFYSITNRAGGLIQGISGSLSGPITNAGTIDGGTLSALDAGVAPYLINSGTIISNSNSETVRIGLSAPTIDNSGTIANFGSGAAISGDFLHLTNGAGATIASGGATAITAGGLNLLNRGTIDGSVYAANPGYANLIDSTGGGRINGDVVLAGTNDTIVAAYVNGALQTGIAGTLNAGAGIDTLRVDFTADQTIGSALQLPATIEQLSLGINNNATITLDPGFYVAGTLHTADGSFGTLINNADLTTTGSAIVSDIFSGVTVDNRATVVANLTNANDAAIRINAYGSFANSGSIDGRGGLGVVADHGSFTNSGTITADRTAVALFNPGGSNSGTIQSRSGIGLVANGNVGIVFNNSAHIEGATSGVLSSIVIDNSGTIAGGDTGVALNPYGGLYNRVGGVVTGTRQGVGAGIYPFAFNAEIYNAGTINGSVNLGDFPSFYGSNNLVVLLPGGVINGDLHLGSGNDTFVTDLVNTGPGAFAGVTGSVTGGGAETLRYRVTQDSSASYVLPAGFAAVGYDLFEGARLALALSSTSPGHLWLAGEGSVDLTGDMTVDNEAVVSTRSALVEPWGTEPTNGLTLTNNGHLTLTRSDPSYGVAGAIQLGIQDSFINNGTITVLNGASYPSPAIGGGTIINAGTIELDTGVAIAEPVSATNSGTIRRLTGGTSVSGVSGFFLHDVTNTGRIEVDGFAIAMGPGADLPALDNSGTIISTASDAVYSAGFSPLTVTNRSGGLISASPGHHAIFAHGGTIINAGAINGDVLLDGSGGRGSYVADGGTLNGNLSFGSANDIFFSRDGATGVSGTIDAGAGIDLFGRFYRTEATTQIGASIPVTFEGELVESIGAATVVTLRGAGSPVTSSLYVGGDGQIVNRAVMNGRVTAIADGSLAEDGIGRLASFTNEGNLAGGFEGTVTAFTNNALVGSSTLFDVAVFQNAIADLNFVNNGKIAAGDDSYAVGLFAQNATHVTVRNTNEIDGRFVLAGNLLDTGSGSSIEVDNSGVILKGANQPAAVALSVQNYQQNGTGEVSIANSGVIEAQGQAATAVGATIFGNGNAVDLNIANSGRISANGGPATGSYYPFFLYSYIIPAYALRISGDQFVSATLTNEVGGLIEATGGYSAAVRSSGTALTLNNKGIISGGPGSIIIDGFFASSENLAGAVHGSDFDDTLRNTGTITGSIDLGAGNDLIENSGTIAGGIFLRAGEDRFVQGLNASFTGTADAGDGDDTLLFDITGGGTIDASRYSPFVNFENFGLVGQGSISTQGVLPVQTLLLDGAIFDLQEGSTLQTLGPVAITGTGGNDHVINHGAIIGDVALGEGDDQLDVHPGSSVSGRIDGGVGSDRLALFFDSSATSPTPIDFSPYASFEQFALGGGTGSLTGNVTFDRIDVDGGRLIGLAGSTINADQGINVASGATFGSAGMVNANIVVGGTLSPGASPGTMTINGNVTLAGGSTTLLEMTPTVSDALVISGALTIQGGATLDITGSRPLTPGVTYDLITTGSGITGSFSTISKAAAVLGFVRQTANAVQLLGTLQLPAGANSQIASTNSYINGLLIGGTATPGVYAALPSLVDAAGFVRTSALATLQPEAYASASQIGIDNGLALSSAVRSIGDLRHGKRNGFFGIGQGFGNWQRLNGDRITGVSGTSLSTSGFLGGLGFASDNIAAAGFVGRVSGNQTITPLAAKTEADGTFIGGSVNFFSEGLQAAGSIIWDDSSADTRRTLYDGTRAVGHYKIKTLTVDGRIGYRFDLGQSGWQLGPQLGLTHVAVKRGGLSETGAGAFSLDVVQRKTKATFLDADLKLAMAEDAPIRLWLSAGWQHQIESGAILATAAFSGVTDQFTVEGAERGSDYAHVEAGIDWSVTASFDLFARGGSLFSSGIGTRNVTVGLRYGF